MNARRIAFVCALIFAGASHAQKYKVAAIPDWVKPISIPEKSSVAKYDITSGYYLTLADYQINLDENASYQQEVIKVLSVSGITRASQLMVTYDTSYQKLKIHHLIIWRKGVKTDRTKELSFEIMNNEYNLQNGIYMGRVTAYDNLTDIRKDDQIDFAYTLTGKNPIFGNGKYVFIPLESDNPIDIYSIRLLYSKEKDYSYKCVDCDSTIQFSETTGAKYRELLLTMRDLKASKLENNIPGWVIPYKYFSLSSFKSWKEVNNWAQNVFSLKTEPNLEGVFKEIFTGTETRDEKINKILDYVQDDIRYMGIEAGIGSIKPFPPAQVAKQRFGDCKDKSLLLVSLLKKIGVNSAYPVLVNVNMQKGLDSLYPSNEVFNHCIVEFDIDSVSYWVDPTIPQQGSDYKNISVGDYGKTLIVGRPYDTLVRMPLRDIRSATKIREEMTIKSFTEPASLEIRSTRYGFEADKRRISLEQYSANDVLKFVADDLKKLFPVANKTSDLVIKDDPKSNVIVTTYNFEVDGFWKDGEKQNDKKLAGLWIFRYEPRSLYGYLSTETCDTRRFDYPLEFPLNLNYRVIFHFPKNMLVYDNYEKCENAAFFFEKKTEQLNPSSFQVTYNFRTKAAFASPSEYIKICEEKNRIVKGLPIVIYFNK